MRGNPHHTTGKRKRPTLLPSPSLSFLPMPRDMKDEPKYVTFEPDHGGFNNIRMAFETVVVLAHAMGRTLVLPPSQRFYLLNKGNVESSKKREEFGFEDFFPFQPDTLDVVSQQMGIEIITMNEFIRREKGRKLPVNVSEKDIFETLMAEGKSPRWKTMATCVFFGGKTPPLGREFCDGR